MTETTTLHEGQSKKVFVTPELAAEWMGRNAKNRGLVKSHVLALIEVMRRGEWTLNGETIKFSADGRLLDGQHRLTACIESQVGFWTWVVYGLDEPAFDTIDTVSRPRRVSDVLSIHGKPNYVSLSAAVKHLWAFGSRGEFYDGGGGIVGFTPRVCMEIIQRRPAIETFVSGAVHNGRVFRSQSLFAALAYLFSCADFDAAQEFVSVIGGGSRDVDRPFNVLREALISRRMVGFRAGVRSIAFMSIRAWNSEISANWIKKVYYKPNEEFPRIAGLDYERLSDYV